MKTYSHWYATLGASALVLFQWLATGRPAQAQPLAALPGTHLLQDLPQDPAAEMIAGIDRFATAQIDLAVHRRPTHWQNPESRIENLDFLKNRLGIVSPRCAGDSHRVLFEYPALYQTDEWTLHTVRWPVLPHPAPQLRESVMLWGEGLLLSPVAGPADTRELSIILLDAESGPEEILSPPTSQRTAAQHRLIVSLLEQGSHVLIPRLVQRSIMQHRAASLSCREYLHRAAYELGRTLLGYEVQILQAAMDHFPSSEFRLCGFGEGARLALIGAAIDDRVDATLCCAYFGPREQMWREPLSRNVFGLLERFGDAEIGALIAPRHLVVSPLPAFAVDLQTKGGAPAKWRSPNASDCEREFRRMLRLADTLLDADAKPKFATLVTEEDLVPAWLRGLKMASDDKLPAGEMLANVSKAMVPQLPHVPQKHARLVAGLDAYTQAVLDECSYERQGFLNIGLPGNDSEHAANAIDTSSVEAYRSSIERFRKVFSQQVIGDFKLPTLPTNARTRQAYAGQNWTGYDVVLDVFDDVFAYGVLLLPRDIPAGQRRPVVVCQHGLEGRPQDTFLGDHHAYHDFAAKLAERGFIVFAPQNPYIGQDDFRTLQRKLNPVGKSLFSVIAPQHAQMLRWLSSLPQVDSERIAFYGLSYGGKSAMRLPALLPQYCLSICSADFNDWVWKNASSRSNYSYIGTGEYEIYEFDLGHRFNYAEMAALIAPRPFMVERGHFDGVAPDDRVAKEFARVRFLFAARLGIPQNCRIEWFNGPHTIHGQGTFDFLSEHLQWPPTGQH